MMPLDPSRQISLQLSEFRRLCVEWEPLITASAKRGNEVSDQIWQLGEAIRTSSDGRLCIENLATDDALPAVRLKAAGACLRWAPEIGMASLRELIGGSTTYGLVSSFAIAVLSMYEAGELFRD